MPVPLQTYSLHFFKSIRDALHIKQLFGLLSPELPAKALRRNNCGGGLSMKTQIPNIGVVRSAWRRVKKDIKDAIIRDVKPVKHAKSRRGFSGKSRSNKGGTGPTGPHLEG